MCGIAGRAGLTMDRRLHRTHDLLNDRGPDTSSAVQCPGTSAICATRLAIDSHLVESGFVAPRTGSGLPALMQKHLELPRRHYAYCGLFGYAILNLWYRRHTRVAT